MERGKTIMGIIKTMKVRQRAWAIYLFLKAGNVIDQRTAIERFNDWWMFGDDKAVRRLFKMLK